jgi:hypothetical protein
MKNFSAVAADVSFLAADTGGNSNLLVLPLPFDKSELSDPGGVQAVLKQELPQASDLQTQKTKVAGINGLVVTGTLNANQADGAPYTTHVTAYLVRSKSGVLDFDFSTADDGQHDATVQTMINSLTLTGITPTVTGQTPPSRYVSSICAALNTWDDKTNVDESAPLKDLQGGKQAPSSVRARVVSIYAAEGRATDQLTATTKASGAPRMPNGEPIATTYLHTLSDIRKVYSAAQRATASAPVTSSAALTNVVNKTVGKLVDAGKAIGDPLDTLNKSSTLAAAIQSDAACATVLDFYRLPTTSGLQVGNCATSNEQQVACTQLHTDEVTLVTSYPGGPTAPWPGNDVMSAFATQNCNAAFAPYVGIAVDQSKYVSTYFSPNPGSDWNSGDREIVCTVENTDSSSQTGSLKGSAS